MAYLGFSASKSLCCYGGGISLYYIGASKSLQMVTVAMKLKDACSLGKKKVMTNQLSI